MRKKLTLALYLCFVELLSYMLVVVPAYSFQVSSSTTGYVRIASQAATQAMVAAQRSATLAAVAPLISGASAGSVAVRMIAGSVGWPVLGVTVGITLAMLYYDSTKAAAIRSAAASPGSWSISGVTLPQPIISVLSDGVFQYTILCDTRVTGSCNAFDTAFQNSMAAKGWSCFVVISNSLPITTGFFAACQKALNAAPPFAMQGASTPATSSQISTYIGGLPANDPNSVESNTVSVGAQASPTPADSTASNPVSSTDVATQVVPATQVQPTDLVVDPNATKPAGTVTNNSTTQTTTTTTTTTVNPDGSTTKQETDSAPVSCTSGNHEVRTFGGILQAHLDLWKGSGLLSALNLLKTLTWPTTIPTYSLSSSVFGNFTLDFSAWSGMLTAIRSIIIAIAGFVAYRMIFVGAR
jgi:hypothetical protein